MVFDDVVDDGDGDVVVKREKENDAVEREKPITTTNERLPEMV